MTISTAPIPLTLHEFRLYASVQIKGVKAHAFVDTGATGVNLTPAAAATLAPVGTTQMRGTFSAQRVAVVNVDDIVFLGKVFANQTADVQMSDPDEAPFAVSALIGASVHRYCSVDHMGAFNATRLNKLSEHAKPLDTLELEA